MRQSTCEGFINVFPALVLQNLLQLNLRPDFFCTDTMGYCPSYNSGFVELNETDWVTAAMAGKPAIAANDDFVDKLYETIRNDPNKNSRPTMKFVHFTDIHMDMLYRAGASK